VGKLRLTTQRNLLLPHATGNTIISPQYQILWQNHA